jgi:NADH dehydrogenase/NADH:ubiquinone oxidoreductase subunit G
LRVLPRTNEDINEEWLSDKSRFACDGLKRQRLTFPMMKDHNGELKPCDWEDAILTVAKVLDSTPGDRLAAVVGGLADAEVSFFHLLNLFCCIILNSWSRLAWCCYSFIVWRNYKISLFKPKN